MPAWEAFRRQALADPALAAQLESAADPEALAALAVRLGAERGLAFAADEVRDAWQVARRAWIERNVSGLTPVPDAASDDTSLATLAGWTPVHVSFAPEGPRVEWRRLGAGRFTEPFFEQAIGRAMRNPAGSLLSRGLPIASLENFERRHRVAPPRGFIFHLSRCGSTLLAQMLAALPHTVVVSEPPPVDQVLGAESRDGRVTRAQRLSWFRGMVHALGQPRTGEERHTFIKLDCWHVLELPLIHEAFPDVPWIFLYRDPVEILVSHRRQRGTQMIPGIVDPRTFGLETMEITGRSFDEYGARVLASIAGAAVTHAGLGRGRLVNFTQLPATLWTELGTHFGLEWSADDVRRMQRASQANAKTPLQPYTSDQATKQREASDELRALAEKWVGESYRQLESLRTAQQMVV
jgi:hypothetical protein